MTAPMYTEATAELLSLDLGRPIGGSGLTAVEILVVDLTDEEGNRGTGFSYALGGGGGVMLAAANDLLARIVTGHPQRHPVALWRNLVGALNRMGRGASYLGIAAIDVAAWDLHAKAGGVPLGVAMGGEMRKVPIYGSAGFRPNMEAAEIVDIANGYAEQGCTAVKLRLAGSREDGERLAAVRDALPATMDLMADANEKCDRVRAMWLLNECARHNLLWLEEPLPAYDADGYAALARNSRSPIASGEHLQGRAEFAPYLKAGQFAIAQPDLAMAGGLTECLRVALLAEACNVSVSPHFLPALFVHLAAAAPNVQWLEHFPLLEPIFDEPIDLNNGAIEALDVPGHGISISAETREKYRSA